MKLDPLVCAIWQAQWRLTKGGMFLHAQLFSILYQFEQDKSYIISLICSLSETKSRSRLILKAGLSNRKINQKISEGQYNSKMGSSMVGYLPNHILRLQQIVFHLRLELV